MISAQPPQLLVAGIGEMVLSADSSTTLVAYGLGSCVALAAWDPVIRFGGLAHFMLPSGPLSQMPVKFVEGGLEAFLGAFEREGGILRRAQFKAAGGAAMLRLGDGIDVGTRNVEAVRTRLAAHGYQVRAKDVGGVFGRTVRLSVGDGTLTVQSLNRATVL